jgi:hypothetical protein
LAERPRWPEIRTAARTTAAGLNWSVVVARFEADIRAAAGI